MCYLHWHYQNGWHWWDQSQRISKHIRMITHAQGVVFLQNLNYFDLYCRSAWTDSDETMESNSIICLLDAYLFEISKFLFLNHWGFFPQYFAIFIYITECQGGFWWNYGIFWQYLMSARCKSFWNVKKIIFYPWGVSFSNFQLFPLTVYYRTAWQLSQYILMIDTEEYTPDVLYVRLKNCQISYPWGWICLWFAYTIGVLAVIWRKSFLFVVLIIHGHDNVCTYTYGINWLSRYPPGAEKKKVPFLCSNQ